MEKIEPKTKLIRVKKSFYNFIKDNRLYEDETFNSILERLTGYSN